MVEEALSMTGPLLGSGAQMYGLLNQLQNQKWQKNFAVDQLNRNQRAIDRGLESWNASSDPARESSLLLRDLMMNAAFGDGGSQQQLAALLQAYPGLLDATLGPGADQFARGMNPQMQQLLAQSADNAGNFQAGQDTAMGNFQSGGATPGRQGAQDRFMDLLNGQGIQMGTLGDVGASLLGYRGQSAVTQGFQDRGMDALNNGGMNPALLAAMSGAGGITAANGQTGTLNTLQSGGLNLFNNQGFNPQNSALYEAGLNNLFSGALGTAGLTEAGGLAELQGLQDIQAGGQTDLSQAMSGLGMNLAGKDALLPLEQVYNMAGEEAKRTMRGAFQKAQRAALARSGGAAGVVAAGGFENDPMSEWADKGSEAVAAAQRQALMGQQGLQLQQQQTGAGLAGAAGNLENQRYSSAGNLVQGMEGNATQRYQANAGITGNALQNALGYGQLGANTALSAQDQESVRLLQALGLLPQVSNAANNNLGTYGNLALGAGGLENNLMNTGVTALNGYNNNRIQGGQLFNSGMNDQNNFALGSGSLANAFGNSYQNANNSNFNNNLNAGQFGLGINNAYMQGNQQLFNNTTNYNQGNLGMFQGAINNLTNLGGQGLAYSTAGLGQVAAPQYINTQPAFQQIAQGLSNVNFGGLAGRGGGSGGGGFDQYNPLDKTWQGGR